MGVHLCDVHVGKDSLDMTLNIQCMKEKFDKSDFSKLKMSIFQRQH